jgi:hypothetical protein
VVTCKTGLESQRNVSENNTLTAPLYCGQVTVLLTWLKKETFFRREMRREGFIRKKKQFLSHVAVTRRVEDVSSKR